MVSTVKTANNEGDILTAKTKAVGECVGAFSLPCLIGNVVQIAVGVGLFVIDRGRDDSRDSNRRHVPRRNKTCDGSRADSIGGAA